MVHSFKLGGRRFAYDSASATLHTLDEIAYKMLDYIELPMPKDCPSALRYDLAKYDSAAISETYDMLYKLHTEGKLYSDEKEFTPTLPGEKCTGVIIRFADGTECTDVNPHILPHALEADGEIGLEIVPRENGALTEENLPELLKETAKLAKELHKSGTDKSPFAPVKTYGHTFAECKGCWIRGLCSLGCPTAVACELERARVECELSLGGT